MNPNEPTGNDFTRRDFMKKSAMTVGAITLLGAGIGLADDGSGSSWWDMKCNAPDSLHFSTSGTSTMTDTTAFNATFKLTVETDKSADLPGEPGYKKIDVIHNFSFAMTAGSSPSVVSGKNSFNAECLDSGLITSSFESSASNPVANNSTTSNFVVNGLYDVALTIQIVRDQGGPDITTKVFGTVFWQETLNPSHQGSLRVPPTGSLDIINTFVPTLHVG